MGQGDLAARDGGQNLRVIEGARAEIDERDCHQHQSRTRHGVEEELDGRVNAAIMAPDADQEVHGHQHHFPEHEEEEEIPGGEHADEAELQQQKEGEEFLGAVVNGFPGKQNRNGRQECRKNNQPQAEAVDAYVIVNFGTRNPHHVSDELLARLAALETHRKTQRDQERDQGNRQREQLEGILLRARNQQRKNEANCRDRNNEVEKVHRVTPSATPIMTSRATEPSTTHVA